MIIKAISEKNLFVYNSQDSEPKIVFKHLIDYFTQDVDLPDPEGHNLYDPTNLNRVEQDFKVNYFCHNKKRHSGNIVFHDILSPDPRDREHITPEILYDIGFKFIELKAPNSLAFMQVHPKADEIERPHIHIMISANEYGSGKQVALSKWEFQQVKTEMKKYVLKEYPQLQHAFKFNQSITLKEKMAMVFKEKLCQAPTKEIFTTILKEAGFQLYKKGKHFGLVQIHENEVQGRRYRLKTLKVADEFNVRLIEWKEKHRQRKHDLKVANKLHQKQNLEMNKMIRTR